MSGYALAHEELSTARRALESCRPARRCDRDLRAAYIDGTHEMGESLALFERTGIDHPEIATWMESGMVDSAIVFAHHVTHWAAALNGGTQ